MKTTASANSAWNPDELPRATRDLDQLKADIDAWGFCFVEQAYAPDELAALHERIEAQAAAERKYGHHQPGVSVQDPEGQNQWVTMLINKGAVFQTVLFNSRVRAVVEHLLGTEHVPERAVVAHHPARQLAASLPYRPMVDAAASAAGGALPPGQRDHPQ